ncbi:ComEA family DNA-binding protein [Deinococcus alpinitundrae]|uniref:ComEA family DNA-binding protein n=1 Tax=Deinococcus alpinitundrae TaxID=468913 RepID=UPI00137B0478|nr:helix-hairpin-helix domain-containing protein [Deinococcus alpinitundrae]
MEKPVLAVLDVALLLTPVSACAKKGVMPATIPTINAATMAKVNINAAIAAKLLKIPGVNTKIAAEIIKNRPYKNSTELVRKVKGIRLKNVMKMMPLLSF